MTTRPAHRTGWLDAAAAAYRAGRPLALLFDYDGTLTPIVRHPSLAHLSTAARARLARLAALPGVAVGVLSGRALDELRALVGLDGVYYAGSGGLELDLRGRRVEYPGAGRFRGTLARVGDALAPVLARFPGAWAERKPVAASLHYRGLDPAAAVRFRAETAAVLDRYPDVRHREVSLAVEVTPAGGWDKGTAVEAILGRLGPDVLPVYAGDAANDSEAMAVVTLAGGAAVGVGPDAPPAATHRAASVDELEVWLDRLVERLTLAREHARAAGSPTPRPVSSVMTPLSHAAPAHGAPASREESSPGEAFSGPGLLIVEPDPALRARYAAAFRRLGWRVWAAGDGEGAIRSARENAAAVRAALVDLQLPGLQGMRVLTDLACLSPESVRCGMSAELTDYAAAAFRRLSTVTLFSKPLDVESVSATLRWLVGVDDSAEPPGESPL